ncbi:BQ2448_2726 [Microbotryum intermedium]|uniref:BQ2448_2726 protein n=1 Tax=Microbotryum intermedium TaxID=269621 RepID=A0A238FIY1_9BASI|nr:BQ2448_2726 [Microbotryum intermedium]
MIRNSSSRFAYQELSEFLQNLRTHGPLPSLAPPIAFNKLYLVRWHRHKDQIPLPTPYLLAREVYSHLKFRLRRLPDGELLEQLM